MSTVLTEPCCLCSWLFARLPFVSEAALSKNRTKVRAGQLINDNLLGLVAAVDEGNGVPHLAKGSPGKQ